jgi:hypothetical protein
VEQTKVSCVFLLNGTTINTRGGDDDVGHGSPRETADVPSVEENNEPFLDVKRNTTASDATTTTFPTNDIVGNWGMGASAPLGLALYGRTEERIPYNIDVVSIILPFFKSKTKILLSSTITVT